jgi:hypothetical protein
MPKQLMDNETRLAMYTTSSPFFVDIGSDENSSIAARFDHLPQNIHEILMSEDTAGFIWNLAVVKNSLSAEQVRSLAHVVRDTIIGEISASKLSQEISQKLDVTGPVTTNLTKEITQKLIAPNYFQISQLYEKAHKTINEPETSQPKPLSGRPLESMTSKTESEPPIGASFASKGEKAPSSLSDWAKLEEDKDAPRVIENKPSKNVVDLRSASGPLPSKLPPAPPVVPK